MDQIVSIKQIRNYIIYAVIFLFVLIVGCGAVFSVDAGTVGVTFNTISGVTETYQQGTYFKLPVITNVTEFDIKTQKRKIDSVGASKDLQEITFEVILNYHLDYTKVNELFVKVGKDYEEKIIIPATNESIKAACAHYPVEKIIQDREKLKMEAQTSIENRLKEYNIILEEMNITDIDFTKEFNSVVEQKQIEEQKIKTAQYQRMQAEEFKKKTILEAEAESTKQNLLRQTTNKDVIALKWIDRWDGKLPEYMMGDKGTVMMVTPKAHE